ncbi:transcriptional regulator, partial [Vibrio parahaemolyticus]|nr:transcriptional regulator [Vibrio parahaemolyticus]
RLETLMSDATGRPIKIRYNPAKRSGELTLGFFTLDDLDDVCKALGFDPSEQM